MEISAKIMIFRPTWVQLKEASLVKMGSINKFILITWQLVHYWDTEKASPRLTIGNDGMRGSPGISPWSHNNLNSYSSTKDVLLNIQTHLRDPILKHVKLGESEPVGEEGKEKSGKGCWVVTTARQKNRATELWSLAASSHPSRVSSRPQKKLWQRVWGYRAHYLQCWELKWQRQFFSEQQEHPVADPSERDRATVVKQLSSGRTKPQATSQPLLDHPTPTHCTCTASSI